MSISESTAVLSDIDTSIRSRCSSLKALTRLIIAHVVCAPVSAKPENGACTTFTTCLLSETLALTTTTTI